MSSGWQSVCPVCHRLVVVKDRGGALRLTEHYGTVGTCLGSGTLLGDDELRPRRSEMPRQFVTIAITVEQEGKIPVTWRDEKTCTDDLAGVVGILLRYLQMIQRKDDQLLPAGVIEKLVKLPRRRRTLVRRYGAKR